jgi:hypothetical protein
MSTAKDAAKPAKDTAAGQELATTDFKSGQLAEGMEAYMGSGTSDFGQADISIPFIRILQSNSPQLNKQDAKYIKGAEMGMILENVSPQTFDGDEGICVIPVYYERSYTEWKPNRGGFVADHGSDPAILKQIKREIDSEGKRRMVFNNGNELAEAALYYIFWAKSPEGPWNQALLALSGTQWKTARDWNTNMARVILKKADGSRIANPVPFAMAYVFTTVGMQKDNNKFYGWKVEPLTYTLALDNGEELARRCSEFRKLATEGRIRGVQDEPSEAPSDDGHVPF